jgi:hypothetical protein
MADVKMPDSIPCKFDATGYRPCKKPTDNGWCTEHEKAKCGSCGGQATRSCDAQMGGLACGYHLCDTCQHAENRHVTKAVADTIHAERRRAEKEGIESKRMLDERGVPEGLPRHLKDLLVNKVPGYVLKLCYLLQIKHTLWGFFPGVLKGTKIIVITDDLDLMFRIWLSMDPRDSKLDESPFYVNEELGVAYPAFDLTDFGKEQSKPHKFFQTAEVEKLFETNPQPFGWAPGLFGAETSKLQFEKIIEKAAKERNISLEASTP